MKLKPLLNIILEEADYRGQHQAPDSSNAPLHDLTANGIYPDDVYSNKAIQYYGTGLNTDRDNYSIISAYRNKPNATVTVYRAMPNLSHDSDSQMKDLQTLIDYVESYGFAPLSSKKMKTYASDGYFEKMRDRWGYGGDFTDKDKYLDFLYKERNALRDAPKVKSEINKGDWITITKQYAKYHMEGEKGWKIVSMKVKAKDIFTDGNSWDEWGYDPQ